MIYKLKAPFHFCAGRYARVLLFSQGIRERVDCVILLLTYPSVVLSLLKKLFPSLLWSQDYFLMIFPLQISRLLILQDDCCWTWFCNSCLLQQTHPHELFQTICMQANRAITRKQQSIHIYIYIYTHIYVCIYIYVYTYIYKVSQRVKLACHAKWPVPAVALTGPVTDVFHRSGAWAPSVEWVLGVCTCG
jgi:hypothetical protein